MSADFCLGVPFNIASYALLLMMVAQVTGMLAGEFIHTFGDLHIYSDHIDKFQLQVVREPLALPTMRLNPNVKDIFDFKLEDFELINYKSHAAIDFGRPAV